MHFSNPTNQLDKPKGMLGNEEDHPDTDTKGPEGDRYKWSYI